MKSKSYFHYDKNWKGKNVTRYVKMYGVISLTAIIAMLFFLTSKTVIINKTKFIPQETKVMIIRENNKFSKKKFQDALKHLNIRYRDVVYAQALIESHNFKSHIFLENNNMFGMKIAHSRPTSSVHLQFNHAYFNTWYDAVVDYALLQATFISRINSEKEYIDYICSFYAQDGSYKQKIISKLKNLK